MERRSLTWGAATAVLFAATLGIAPSAALAADGKPGAKQEAETGAAPSPSRVPSDAAAAAARAQALEEGWPDTPAGMVASGWVRAFSGGEKRMRAFLERQVTKQSLRERPMEQRIESYVALRERLGDLTLHSVAESTPDRLTVVLLAEDAAPHRFVFTVEKEPPHRLLQVGLIPEGHGHGGHGRR